MTIHLLVDDWPDDSTVLAAYENKEEAKKAVTRLKKLDSYKNQYLIIQSIRVKMKRKQRGGRH